MAYSEIYVRIALEDSLKVRNGQVLHFGSNRGEISELGCERDARLFASGAETVAYMGNQFVKRTDVAHIVDNLAIREMWYYPKD